MPLDPNILREVESWLHKSRKQQIHCRLPAISSNSSRRTLNKSKRVDDYPPFSPTDDF